MENTRKDYEREEEKKKDRRVLLVFIPILLLIVLCLWLFRDVEKDISKNYEAVMVETDGIGNKKVTVEIKGKIVYETMFADEFYTGDIGIYVKDEAGNLLFEAGSGLPTLPEEYGYWNVGILRGYMEDEEAYGHIGLFYFDDALEQIRLELDKGTYIVGPANNLEEAEIIIKK